MHKNVGKLAQMANLSCEICTGHSADIFCRCLFPPALCCKDCFPNHLTKGPDRHVSMLIAWLRQDFGSYCDGLRHLIENRTAAQSSMEAIDQCCREVTAAVGASIQSLLLFQDNLLQRLREDQEKLQAAFQIAEKEAHICLIQCTRPTNPLTEVLLKAQPEELKVFSYFLTPPDWDSLCGHWVAYYNSLPNLCERFNRLVRPAALGEVSPTYLLTYVENKQVTLLNPLSNMKQCMQLRRSIRVDAGSRYVWAGCQLFCSGGSEYIGLGQGSKEAYLLQGGSLWEVVQLANMLEPRFNHGLWWEWSKHCVLVFGGRLYTGKSRSVCRR